MESYGAHARSILCYLHFCALVYTIALVFFFSGGGSRQGQCDALERLVDSLASTASAGNIDFWIVMPSNNLQHVEKESIQRKV